MTDLPEIISWDVQGVPIFTDDELDQRYQCFIDRVRRDAPNYWFDIDNAFMSLVYSDADLNVAEEALQLLDELIKRAWLRRRAVEVALGLVAGP